METIIRPIAHIKSDFTDKFGIPRQSGLVPELTARIMFEPEYRDPNALVEGSVIILAKRLTRTRESFCV